MDWRRIFEPQGLNWWTVVSGIGMNFALMSFLIIIVTYASSQGIGGAWHTLIMSAGGFLIPLLTAYVCGRISDERYLTYAFYPLIGYMILAVPSAMFAGVFGILLVVFGVLGAFNGGNLAARHAMRRRHAILADIKASADDDKSRSTDRTN